MVACGYPTSRSTSSFLELAGLSANDGASRMIKKLSANYDRVYSASGVTCDSGIDGPKTLPTSGGVLLTGATRRCTMLSRGREAGYAGTNKLTLSVTMRKYSDGYMVQACGHPPRVITWGWVPTEMLKTVLHEEALRPRAPALLCIYH
jgi:hypothetical protein